MTRQMDVQQSASSAQVIAAIDSSGNLSAISLPTGPTGPTGPIGDQGLTGSTGPTGSSLSFPAGMIMIYYPSDTSLTSLNLLTSTKMGVPSGWVICDGTNGTPDLRGRFVLMAQDTIPTINVPPGSSVHAIGQIGGREKHVLTIDEMPAHSHEYERVLRKWGSNPINREYSRPTEVLNSETSRISNEGGNQPHEIMPPYYTLVYIMKL